MQHMFNDRMRSRRLWQAALVVLLLLALQPHVAIAQSPAPRITDLTLGASTDGRPITAVRIVQDFERARLEYDPTQETPQVQLTPLGWYLWQQQHLHDPTPRSRFVKAPAARS